MNNCQYIFTKGRAKFVVETVEKKWRKYRLSPTCYVFFPSHEVGIYSVVAQTNLWKPSLCWATVFTASRMGLGCVRGDSSSSPDTPSTLSKIWKRSKATFHAAFSNLCLFPNVILLPVLHSRAAFSWTWLQLQIS